MNRLLLTFIFVTTTLFVGALPANAGLFAELGLLGPKGHCIKKKGCPEEVCRRTFCSTRTVCGCEKVTHFEEITYKVTYQDKCGNSSCRIYTVTSRCN